MAHDLGDVIPLTVDIADANDAPANASAVVLTVTLPDDTVVAPTVTNPETGRYQADYQTVQAGRHQVRWVATGTNAGAYSDVFDVRPAALPFLISLADAKSQLNIDPTVTTQDEQLRRVIEATTGVIERHTGETVVKRTFVETFRQPCSQTLVLTHTPVVSLVSAVGEDGVVWDLSDLAVDPVSGVVSRGWNIITPAVTITYRAGMAIIPAHYLEAAEIIVQHLWETKRGNSGGPRFAGMDDTTGIQGMSYAIPNRALELLGDAPPMVG